MNYLEQFEQLRRKVPYVAFNTVDNENSPYCQYTEKSKNCYMTFASYQSQDCMYNHRVFYCTDCTDCSLCQNCELCYQCIDCIKCYNSTYSAYCENAIDSDFCYFCVGVQNCFGCVGLHKKQFCIANRQFSPEEYKRQVAELKCRTPEEILRFMEPLLAKVPRVAMYGKNNEGSFGENMHNCKDTYWVFDSKGLRDSKYVYHCDDSNDLLDCSNLGWSEQCYEIMSGGNLNNCMFCYSCWNSHDLAYCELVHNSHDCLLCVGLNRAEYRILNMQYSKEDYHLKAREVRAAMVAEGTWGVWQASTYPEVITYGL